MDNYATCPVEGCNYSTTIRLCRGTRIANNKGYMYEACLGPADNGHFIRWRRDLGEHDVPKLPPPQNVLEIMQQNLTPLHIPVSPPKTPSVQTLRELAALAAASRNDLFNAAPPSTPSRTANRAIYTPSPFRDTSTRENSHPDGSTTNTPKTTIAPSDNTSIPSNSPPSLVPLEAATAITPDPAPLEIDHTRLAVNRKGAVISACNGSICRGPPVLDAVRFAKDCSNQYCKKCCLSYQRSGRKICSMASHNLTTAVAPKIHGISSNAPTVAGVTPEGIATATGIRLVASSGSSSHQVLRKEHYDAREKADRNYQLMSNKLIEKKAAEDVFRTTIKLLYWNVSPKKYSFIV